MTDLRRIKNRLLIGGFILLLGLLLGTSLPANASVRTVKVGVFPLGNFHQVDDSGNAKGYNMDYLKRIAEYTHWKIEYVDSKSWTESLAMLDSGEIDILAPAQKTPEREQKYIFSAMSMSTEMGAIYVRSDRDDLTYEDYDAMKSLTYGVIKNSPITDSFVSSCQEKGFTPKLKYYINSAIAIEAFRNKEIEALSINIMLGDTSMKMIGRYSPSPVYYIATPKNQDLITALDGAMTEILLAEPDFASNLFARYFQSFSFIQQSYDEKKYIDDLGVVTVAYYPNQAPLSYTDKTTGEFAGISRDILDRISELSGITFNYEELTSSHISYDYLKEHGIYVMCNVEFNDINSSMKRLHLTTPYLSSQKLLVGSSSLEFNSNDALKVAVYTGSGTLGDVIKQAYPNYQVTNYDSVEACFDAVVAGEMDATLQNYYVTDAQLTNPAYSNLRILPIQSLSDKLSLATIEYDGDDSTISAKLNNGMFCSIIDKAINQLTTDECNDIVMANVTKSKYDVSIWDLVKKNRLPLVLAIIIIMLIIGLLSWRQIFNQVKARELAAKNAELSDAINQAKRANAAKSQFLSRMSHEIRTPMNAIVGITAIAKHHEEEPERIDDYLTKIDSSSHVLLAIINDVLDMSAIENEKLKIACAEFDIKKILNNIATVYYPQCKNKNITLSIATDIENELLMGDSLRVNQVLMNLISNAYKFTEEGGAINITAKETTKRMNNTYIRFTISDTGCGMSEDLKERLFRPFEQESASTAIKHGGSGLGLSITKNLVDMMHGAISVESTKGEGTTFTVDLPFTYNPPTISSDISKLKDIYALVVDDDESTLEYTSLVLERIGVKYDMASTGIEAVTLAKDKASKGLGYDICFVDWKMPEMSGIEVASELRKLFASDIMIIIVSGYNLNEIETEAMAAGVDKFVTKPLFQSSVFNILMSLSGGKYVNQRGDINSYDFTGHRVLLAEDNDLNREIATELLHMVHMELDAAVNGKDAVEQFEASTPGYYDLILMDVQMPEMDGHEATKAIRSSSHPDSKSIPIYAMTANAFAEDISAALNAGMTGHIAKPIDTAILYNTMDHVINKTK